MLAGSLGVLVLALALLAARRRRYGIAQVLVAAALVGDRDPAVHARRSTSPRRVLAALGEAMLLFAALRWSQHRPRARRRR